MTARSAGSTRWPPSGSAREDFADRASRVRRHRRLGHPGVGQWRRRPIRCCRFRATTGSRPNTVYNLEIQRVHPRRRRPLRRPQRHCRTRGRACHLAGGPAIGEVRMPEEATAPIPNGIDVTTGQPPSGIRSPPSWTTGLRRASSSRRQSEQTSLDRDFRRSPTSARSAMSIRTTSARPGGGSSFPPTPMARVKEALKPLLDHRQAEAGPLFKIFEGADGYRPGETALHG